MSMRSGTFAACIAVVAIAGVAQAQSANPPADRADALLNVAVAPQTPPPVNDGEAYHRAEDSEQDPAELRTTQALNDEIASRNQLAQNQEDADRAKYEETVSASNETRLAYEEDVRRSQAARSDWEAEQARWQAERARWEADVRACEAGDRSRCSTRVR
ncbi:hypothetical protein [Brevundimonas sp.]